MFEISGIDNPADPVESLIADRYNSIGMTLEVFLINSNEPTRAVR